MTVVPDTAVVNTGDDVSMTVTALSDGEPIVGEKVSVTVGLVSNASNPHITFLDGEETNDVGQLVFYSASKTQPNIYEDGSYTLSAKVKGVRSGDVSVTVKGEVKPEPVLSISLTMDETEVQSGDVCSGSAEVLSDGLPKSGVGINLSALPSQNVINPDSPLPDGGKTGADGKIIFHLFPKTSPDKYADGSFTISASIKGNESVKSNQVNIKVRGEPNPEPGDGETE